MREHVKETGRYAAPVALGMVPLGLAFGLLVTQLGFSWWWAPIFSVIIYAGSLEFLLAAMIAGAAPLAQIAVTTLVVNSRHVFYALSFPLHQVRGRTARAYSTYALTDEAYALTTTAEAATWPGKKVVLLQVLLQAAWVGGTTLGALLGTALQPGAVQGFEFALTALFLVLAIEAYTVNPRWGSALAALACGLGGALVAPQYMLLVAYCAYFLLLIGAYALSARRGKNSDL